MSEKFIEFKNVTYTYEPEEQGEAKPSPALCNIDLTVNRGEFVAVLGHNGSGKSTLAKLTNAILVPESGTVTVDGIDTSDEDRLTDIRRKVGMVFQNPDNQIVATIVEDDVAFGPENLGVAPDEIRRRVDDALKAVGMYDYRLREPHKLSGGQKQRVAIAGIIAMQTGCIVLDEPTAMLDPRGRREVFDTVRRLNREMGITVLFVTHFMDDTGILMIIAAVFSIIAGVFVGGLGALAAGLGAASGLTFAYWAALFLTLIGGICQLIAGIKGVKHSKRSEKAGGLIV